MARDPLFELLYETFDRFKRQCLSQDGSLLWPEKEIWTRENLLEIKARFIEDALFGSSFSFEEKLQQQLQGGSPNLWALMADIYYIYFLPSDFITFEKKQKDIQWAAQQAGLNSPPLEDPLWEAQKKGFTRTGQQYHRKYRQFRLIVLFALRVKESYQSEAILNNPERMQAVLDEVLESIPKINRAYDMRNTFLYLSFPDRYERIISTQDKKAILKKYRDLVTGLLPEDLDKALRKVREALAPQYETGETPFDFYRNVKHEWKPGAEVIVEPGPTPAPGGELPGPPTVVPVEDPDQIRVKAVLGYAKNAILYGPPGTGKTYIARKVAEALIEPQLKQGLTEPAAMLRVIDGLTFHEILALAMYTEGARNSYSVPELEQKKLVQARFGAAPVKNPNNSIWGYLQSHTDPASTTVKTSQRSHPFLFEKDNSGRWSLTEGGRQYVEERLEEQLNLLKPNRMVAPRLEDFIRWASFHQSYAYEDFVEGLRPKISNDDQGSISYEITPGVFREICTLAAQDPENKYILVIDEINRGNIAKILGELITLLEDDKRGNTYVTLPYSKDAFSVPENLYIIGTMNTADRSIALLDVALRRRFAFVDIMPRPDLLLGEIVETEGTSVALDQLLQNLNASIARQIDRDHQIGHSYFLKVKDADHEQRLELLDFVWNNQIIPLLEEYFYSRRDQLKEVLAPFVTPVGGEAEDEAAALPIGRAHGEDLVDSLSRL